MELINENELPKSRCEILKWARIYFNLTPSVNDIITEAVTKLGDIQLKYSDKKSMNFYQSLAYNDKFNLDTFIHSMALSYFKFGEAIPFGNMVENKDGQSVWDKFILLEPELVSIETDLISQDSKYSLIITEEIKQHVEDGTITQPSVVKAVKSGIDLELPERDISLLAHFTDPSATRGTSPIQSLFRDLLYLDKIRCNKLTFLERLRGKKSIETEITIIDNRIRKSLSLKTHGNLPQVRKVISNWIERKFFKPVMMLNNMKTSPDISWIV